MHPDHLFEIKVDNNNSNIYDTKMFSSVGKLDFLVLRQLWIKDFPILLWINFIILNC